MREVFTRGSTICSLKMRTLQVLESESGNCFRDLYFNVVLSWTFRNVFYTFGVTEGRLVACCCCHLCQHRYCCGLMPVVCLYVVLFSSCITCIGIRKIQFSSYEKKTRLLGSETFPTMSLVVLDTDSAVAWISPPHAQQHTMTRLWQKTVELTYKSIFSAHRAEGQRRVSGWCADKDADGI